jgi:hypothetical protein
LDDGGDVRWEPQGCLLALSLAGCDVTQRSSGGCVGAKDAAKSVLHEHGEVPRIAGYVEDGAAEVARVDLSDGRGVAEAMIHRIEFEAEIAGEMPFGGGSDGVSSGAR